MTPTTDCDYIVIGAGAAGCVLADRLSADGSRLLLLEAGPPDKRQEIHIPAAWSKLFKSEVDWNYATAPQAELDGRQIYWPRGKMLGGCTSINAQMYIRGHALDFDAWPQLGAPGWSYAEVLPYFRRSERNVRGADDFHGGDGALDVAELREPNPLTHLFLRAAEQVGLPRNDDFNGSVQDGVGLTQVMQRQGKRCSAALAFLKPALSRPNLTLVTEALATRILLDGRKAIGVRYLRDGREETALASREVILAGGAVNSPQLLMLSGIGPAAELKRLGLPVLHDLRGVGQHLQDHVAAPVMAAIRGNTSLKAAQSLGNIIRFLFLRRGMLTSNVGEAAAFLRTQPDLPAPDLELIFAPVLFEHEGTVPPSRHGITIGSVLLQPHSTGSIRLTDADPRSKPIIDANYLADARDRAILLQGIRTAIRIFEAPAFADVVSERLVPAPASASDEPLLEHIRRSAHTLYHPIGTCRMGQDPEAVVDPALCVHGLDSLRVADASVMPSIVRGHTQAATMMIAERAAELIAAASRASASLAVRPRAAVRELSRPVAASR